MTRRRLLPCLLLTSTAAFAQSSEFLLETADGSILAVFLAADLELIFESEAKEMRFPAASLRRLAISSVGEKETAKLCAEAFEIGGRWREEDYKVREAATQEALKMSGAAAPVFARLADDGDPEVAARAKEVLEALRIRKELFDPRDLMEADGRVLRGRLRLETLNLDSALGPVRIARAEVRTLRRRDAVADPVEWPPPLATRAPVAPAEGSLLAVLHLRGGWRLVGEGPVAALSFMDKSEKAFPADGLIKAVRDNDNPGFFRLQRRGAAAVPAALVHEQVEFTAAGARWAIPADRIESIVFGPLRAEAGALASLVHELLRWEAAGGNPPLQRFWVHINDQQANPWDSAGKKGMTWSLLKVTGDACLVGSGEGTNAYNGDTSIKKELPILAIRKRDLEPPEGLDVSDDYSGWCGGELRLTRPIRGTEMDSLETANRLIEEEFGPGWRMAEFHDTSTLGWHWWGYWVDRPEPGAPK